MSEFDSKDSKKETRNIITMYSRKLAINKEDVRNIPKQIIPTYIAETATDIALIQMLAQEFPMTMSLEKIDTDNEIQERLNGLKLLGVNDPEALIKKASDDLMNLPMNVIARRTIQYYSNYTEEVN